MFTIRIRLGQREVACSAPFFEQREKEQLGRFVSETRRLNGTRFVRECESYDLSIHLRNDGGVASSSVKLPDDEVLEAFLHRLRPIYLNNEELNFARIANVVSRRFRHPTFTFLMRDMKETYTGKMTEEVFEARIERQLVNSEEFLNNYLNSAEFHRDMVRGARRLAVANILGPAGERVFVVLLLRLKLNAINRLASLVGTMLNSEESGEVTINLVE